MVEADPEAESVLECSIRDCGAYYVDVNVPVKEKVGFFVADGKRYEVKGGQPRLSSTRDEDYDRVVGTVFLYGCIARFVHGSHAGAVCSTGKALDVYLLRNRTDRRPKIVHSDTTIGRIKVDSHPFSEVPRIGKGRGETEDPRRGE